MIVSDRFSPPPTALGVSRNAVIAGGVVLFHVGALWALQSGLLRRAVEVVVPVEILSQLIEPPKPADPPPPP
ncbi:MAG: energy transducer TonB, partial [Variovorax sp.]